MSQPYVGEIRMVGFSFAPVGWATCDGQLTAISQNTVLFDLIGTTYGGDGQNTFALPDLRGRLPLHMGNGFVQGGNGGQETVTLTTNQLPAHSHVPLCNSAASDSTKPTSNYWGNWADAQFSDQTPAASMNAGAVGSVGGSQPHDNMIPFLAINFIISLFGIFPSQN